MERGGRGAAGVTIGSIKTQDKEKLPQAATNHFRHQGVVSYSAGSPLWVLRRIPFEIVKI